MRLRIKSRTKWLTDAKITKKMQYRIRAVVDDTEVGSLIKELEKLKKK